VKALGLPTKSASALRTRLPDLLGLGWVVAAGVGVLVPAMIHGFYLGPYDILSASGLTAQHGGVIHNPSLRDQIALFIPFTNQAWNQVHQGHLPLWNPYSGLGMPLAFNWESAPFGLPAFIGYLVPLRYAYTVGVLVTVAVAGTGAYVFARVLRLGVIASAFVGTTFVLSGSMLSLLGWTATSVGSWSGWLFASAVLVIRGKHRARAVCGFAVVLAFAIYAGHPETAFMVLLALAIFVVAVLAGRSRGFGTSRPIRRPIFDLAIGGLAGAGLAAPLLLPGIQLIGTAGRIATGNYASLTTPDHGVLQFLFQGFDGLPVAGSAWFGSLSYQWTSAYVGVIALVMGAVAIGTRWKRPEVLGLVAAIAVLSTLVLVPGVPSALNGLPIVGEVILTRALIPICFGLSVLAGIGLDALVRDHASVRVQRWARDGFAVAAVSLLVIWIFGRGHLPPFETRLREVSFLWPAIGVTAGLAVVGVPSKLIQRRWRSVLAKAPHVAAGILLACETAFLMTAGAPLQSSSPHPLTATPAVMSLQKTVGRSLVGLGSESCIAATFLGASGQGILPEANIMFQIHEFAFYEPLAPTAYYSLWHSLTGSDGGSPYYYQFCPAVTSVAIAQRFGITYVLEAPPSEGPVGSEFVESVGGDRLYRIPGAAPATLVPARIHGPFPPDGAVGTPVTVHHPDPATWSISTAATTTQVLRLRITDVPGWSATIDGRPLDLHQFSRLMLQARIPPGRHAIVVRYLPTAFIVGIVLAGCSAAGLASALLIGYLRRRRRSESPRFIAATGRTDPATGLGQTDPRNGAPNANTPPSAATSQ